MPAACPAIQPAVEVAVSGTGRNPTAGQGMVYLLVAALAIGFLGAGPGRCARLVRRVLQVTQARSGLAYLAGTAMGFGRLPVRNKIE